ncbi:MAG: zinc-dependent peptidase [Nitrosomonas sp.]|nr:zinc-dependent peptidase [Nitrosomonas sp.]
MSWHLNHWRFDSVLKHEAIPETIWQKLIHLHCLKGLNSEELKHLHELVLMFLHTKVINNAHGLEITDEMRATIAIQACLPILNLDLEYYDNWIEIIVYPGEFILDYDYVDNIGIVHRNHKIVSGETWFTGPIILSWQDIICTSEFNHRNIVIHEFAHTLDMLHEGANGCPPLHANMSASAWRNIFSRHYASFCRQTEAEQETVIDPYAAESPAEFFAVLSEVFFESPFTLKQHMPSIYEQLALFYRQDPFKRWINA